ncbi:MAG: ParB/RepB/Spo0J family partition protein [Paracoccaceae bacterium]
MARRRRVDTPSAEELKTIEEGFAAKPVIGMKPPIAQVAAEAAALAQPVAPEDRADAERFRAAQAEGRVILDLPSGDIQVDELTRDRAVIDAEAMAELKASISAHGQRHPIDVVQLEEGGYGLLSGYRRLKAITDLHGPEALVRAMLRAPKDLTEAYVAMVEENEIRDNLSHYERGRIAVLAAGQGVFQNSTVAVQFLFAAASKSKRSKIRSFAMIHEELGDLLNFPEAITERAGLRLAAALRLGQGGALRDALANASPANAAAEWRILALALDQASGLAKPEAKAKNVSQAKLKRRVLGETGELANGVTMVSERDVYGYSIRLDGPHVDEEFVETVLRTVHGVLNEV